MASDSDLDDGRRHVVWGVGAVPAGLQRAEGDDDLAEAFARGADPDWDGLDDRWAIIVEGDEEEIESVIVDADSVRGRAPYLAPGRTDEVAEGYMSDTLRGDVGPRRKVEQPRPV